MTVCIVHWLAFVAALAIVTWIGDKADRARERRMDKAAVAVLKDKIRRMENEM